MKEKDVRSREQTEKFESIIRENNNGVLPNKMKRHEEENPADGIVIG